MNKRLDRFHAGFTLVELVVVIVIVAILGAVFASFTTPLRGVFDARMRATLSDTLDSAYRRISRDLQRAVPNSIRLTSAGGSFFLQLVPTQEGGRYLDDGSTQAFDFDTGTASFTFAVLDPDGSTVANTHKNDRIVVFNLGPGSDQADLYAGKNWATVSALDPTARTLSVSFTNAPSRLLDSPSDRFQIVDQAELAVTYRCPGANSTPGNLQRCQGEEFTSVQPTNCDGPILASHVRCINLDYTKSAYQWTGMVYMQLQAFDPRCAASVSDANTNGCEHAELVYQVHVDNAP